MKKFICLTFLFFSSFAIAQEQTKKESDPNTFKASIGVVDMKRILAQSKAYQSLVDQFENVRRKQRNAFTKQEDIIRDEESELLKKKTFYLKKYILKKLKH